MRNDVKTHLFTMETQHPHNFNKKMTVFTHTNLCEDRRDDRRQTCRFTHLIWTLWRKKLISGGEIQAKKSLPSSGSKTDCRNCDTHCSVQDLSSFCLLLPDSGEGPLWRLVVLFVAGLTLIHTNPTNVTQAHLRWVPWLCKAMVHLSESSELLSLWPSSFHRRCLSISSLR